MDQPTEPTPLPLTPPTAERGEGFRDAMRALDRMPYDDGLALVGVTPLGFVNVMRLARAYLGRLAAEDDVPTLREVASLDDPGCEP